MPSTRVESPARFQIYGRRNLHQIPQLACLDRATRLAMEAVAWVLPFRVNQYVIDELIHWDEVPDDPIFQLTFPQPGMLAGPDLRRMTKLVAADAPREVLEDAARTIQRRLNPHPAQQLTLNVPKLDGRSLRGMQHKYRETVLFFPSEGQTCHTYCTYCFRWPQFVGIDELKFASREADNLVGYLRRHPEVTSVLFTGGDPLVMRTAVLRRYIEPILDARLEHLVSIRIGTKATSYWPYRFLTDRDADDLLRLFDQVRAAGKHLALMAHVTHPRELEPPAVATAFRRLQSTGAIIRCQAPLIRHVNDDATAWARMWRKEVALGAIPYYMFVERDTGPKGYFEVPLARALEIFQAAYQTVSGLARTVRGPSMSAPPGKVVIRGVTEVDGNDVFVLELLQARDPRWVGRPFFAKFDAKATWLDDLTPAFGAERFFFEREKPSMQVSRGRRGRQARSASGAADLDSQIL